MRDAARRVCYAMALCPRVYDLGRLVLGTACVASPRPVRLPSAETLYVVTNQNVCLAALN